MQILSWGNTDGDHVGPLQAHAWPLKDATPIGGAGVALPLRT